MIVRILGEGQLRVDDAIAAELTAIDRDLEAAVERNDQAALSTALTALLARARQGTPLPPDSLEPSDVIIPYEDASGMPRDDIQAELDRMGAGGSIDLELERLKGELTQGEAPKQIGGADGASQPPAEPPLDGSAEPPKDGDGT